MFLIILGFMKSRWRLLLSTLISYLSFRLDADKGGMLQKRADWITTTPISTAFKLFWSRFEEPLQNNDSAVSMVTCVDGFICQKKQTAQACTRTRASGEHSLSGIMKWHMQSVWPVWCRSCNRSPASSFSDTCAESTCMSPTTRRSSAAPAALEKLLGVQTEFYF